MRRPVAYTMVVAVILTVWACGDDTEAGSPAGDGRTYYESLELGSPVAAARTFTEAYARDDFMTVWLVLDSEARFQFQQHQALLEYDRLIRTDRIDPATLGEEILRAASQDGAEPPEPWYLFDRFMLVADEHDALLLDLSNEASFGEGEVDGERATVRAEMSRVEGEVTFHLTRSPGGRWHVHQVVVPGGDEAAIPWSVPAGG
jgi:hypothetical protein